MSISSKSLRLATAAATCGSYTTEPTATASVMRWVVVAWIVRAALLGKWERGPRAADPCGPAHRYIWVGTFPYCDLSFEPK
jgi:hypothetical protein